MAPKIDQTERLPYGGVCAWCAEEDEQLMRYGTLHLGQMYWSSPLCSVACHDEAHDDGQEAR